MSQSGQSSLPLNKRVIEIYALVDPRIAEPFYIGKRCTKKRYGWNSDVTARLADLQASSISKQVIILDTVCTDPTRNISIWDWPLVERAWISYYRYTLGLNLLNRNDGGGGGSIGGFKLPPRSAEHSRKISEARRGWIPPPELRARWSLSKRGKPGIAHTPASRQKIASSMPREVISRKLRGRKVTWADKISRTLLIRGSSISSEGREAIRQSSLGNTHAKGLKWSQTVEARQKISIARTEYWQKVKAGLIPPPKRIR